MPRRRLASLAVVAALGTLTACAPEAPFVQSDYRYHQLGQVRICYNDANTTPEKIQSMADDVCKQYERVATLWLQQKYQCNWTAPTLATFYCHARPGENPPPIQRKNAPMRHDPNLVQ